MTETSPKDTTKVKFINYFNDKTVVFKTWFPFTAGYTTTTQKKRLCGRAFILPTSRFVWLKLGRCCGRN